MGVVIVVLTLVAACSDDDADTTSVAPVTTTLLTTSVTVPPTTTLPVTTTTTAAPTTTTLPPPPSIVFGYGELVGGFTQGAIYRVEPLGGSGPTLLYSNSGFVAHPAWSPDGSRIAFVRGTPAVAPNDYGGGELVVMNADGSNPVSLTPGNLVVDSFDWSPDGTRIAYSIGPAESGSAGQANIFVIPFAGGASTQLTTVAGAVNPVWSPDGTGILYELGAYIDEIYWESSLWKMSADGSGAVFVAEGNGPINTWHGFSPDGDTIVFSSHGEGGGGAVWRWTAAGLVQLTGTNLEAWSPVFSPDGTKIAFVGHQGGTESPKVFVMGPDGSNQTPLADADWGSGLSWSSDGSRLTYRDQEPGSFSLAIWVVDVATGIATQITGMAGTEDDPRWSPW
jgi:Tol biopolymer transport system component